MNTCTVFTIFLIGIIGAQALPMARDFLQIMKVSSSSIPRNESQEGIVDVEHLRCVRNAFTLSAEEKGYVDLWKYPSERFDTILKEFEKCGSLPSDKVDDCIRQQLVDLQVVLWHYHRAVQMRDGFLAKIYVVDAARYSCPMEKDPLLPETVILTIVQTNCIRNGYTGAAEENRVADLWKIPNDTVGKSIERSEKCEQLENALQVRTCKVREYFFVLDVLIYFIDDVLEIKGAMVARRVLQRAAELYVCPEELRQAISTQDVFRIFPSIDIFHSFLNTNKFLNRNDIREYDIPSAEQLQCINDGLIAATQEYDVYCLWKNTSKKYDKILKKFRECEKLSDNTEIENCKVKQVDKITDLFLEFYMQCNAKKGYDFSMLIVKRVREICDYLEQR